MATQNFGMLYEPPFEWESRPNQAVKDFKDLFEEMNILNTIMQEEMGPEISKLENDNVSLDAEKISHLRAIEHQVKRVISFQVRARNQCFNMKYEDINWTKDELRGITLSLGQEEAARKKEAAAAKEAEKKKRQEQLAKALQEEALRIARREQEEWMEEERKMEKFREERARKQKRMEEEREKRRKEREVRMRLQEEEEEEKELALAKERMKIRKMKEAVRRHERYAEIRAEGQRKLAEIAAINQRMMNLRRDPRSNEEDTQDQPRKRTRVGSPEPASLQIDPLGPVSPVAGPSWASPAAVPSWASPVAVPSWASPVAGPSGASPAAGPSSRGAATDAVSPPPRRASKKKSTLPPKERLLAQLGLEPHPRAGDDRQDDGGKRRSRRIRKKEKKSGLSSIGSTRKSRWKPCYWKP